MAVKAKAVALLIAFSSSLVQLPSARSQSITVTLEGVGAVTPAKGTTEQLNVSQGQRTTLSVGNGVQLGTSAQMTSSVGTISLSRSVLEPTSVFLGSSIGPNTVINIENITAAGNGGAVTTDNNSSITVGDGTTYASGKAVIDGMTASSDIKVDTNAPLTSTGQGRAEYYAIVNPQIQKSDDPFFIDKDGNYHLVDKVDEDGNIVRNADGTAVQVKVEREGVNACTPTANKSCVYTDADILKTGNASASSNYQTTTNIDINSSSFTNVFGQAF